jgi:hypothetical protein
VRFAEKLASDFRSVDSGFKRELLEHFSPAEMAELGLMIGQYMALGRMLVIFFNDTATTEIYTTGD